MNRGVRGFLGVAVLVAALGLGYWLGGRQVDTGPHSASVAGSAPAAQVPAKPLYYRNPMGLPDTSPVPKKDPMGMDYIPVFENDANPASAAGGTVPNGVTVSAEKVQQLGVRTEKVQLRSLDKTIRAAGRVEPDERRQYAISPKFEGYVEKLHVNVTGQSVAQGQPLFEVYAPELVSLQREYAIAAQGVVALQGADSPAQQGMKRLVESSQQRLKNWDISEEQIKGLVASGQTQRTMTFRSPVAGLVTEKRAVQGMRFMAGESLYQVTDLSAIWVIADVFEQDIGAVRNGSLARIRINAYPDKVFQGRVTYVYPTMKPETRTVSVRIELANPGLLLKPAMFAQVEVPVAANAKRVTVPLSAVIDSGTRQMVLVQQTAGRFEPREVQLGERSDSHVVVQKGLSEGEQVVVSANFLIDAESNLKAAVGGFGTTDKPAAGSAKAGHVAQGTVLGVDAKALSVTMSHGPVASLKWPAMTMEFQVANPALLKDLKVGAALSFEFVERGQGEWVITGVKAPASAAHTGH
ncbi:MAG: efflux RND transporter periplasmic adaptor subunit [Rhodoferax sp.]|nr:efflux RND transporter periplasmic adaptor subunit [Rhodoferax sp.]MCF8208987.1 efflux RND transporter periplasmic adaptor subunit [Rhodoferax sp.]